MLTIFAFNVLIVLAVRNFMYLLVLVFCVISAGNWIIFFQLVHIFSINLVMEQSTYLLFFIIFFLLNNLVLLYDLEFFFVNTFLNKNNFYWFHGSFSSLSYSIMFLSKFYHGFLSINLNVKRMHSSFMFKSGVCVCSLLKNPKISFQLQLKSYKPILVSTKQSL